MVKKILTLLLLLCCTKCNSEKSVEKVAQSSITLKSNPMKVIEIPVPKGCTLDTFGHGSFSHYVQHLPLTGSVQILAHDGNPVYNEIYRVLAVVNMPLLFNDNLEQCADYAMRLWAEYHKVNNKLAELYLFNYPGKRTFFNPEKSTLTKFLRTSFANSNSYSLKMGCQTIDEKDIIPGDLIVQNDDGGIGHVSMIMSSCRNVTGDTYYLIGFSFMPAQEFHIENAMRFGKDGWYTLHGYYEFLKNHLDLGDPVLRRF